MRQKLFILGYGRERVKVYDWVRIFSFRRRSAGLVVLNAERAGPENRNVKMRSRRESRGSRKSDRLLFFYLLPRFYLNGAQMRIKNDCAVFRVLYGGKFSVSAARAIFILVSGHDHGSGHRRVHRGPCASGDIYAVVSVDTLAFSTADDRSKIIAGISGIILGTF